MQGGAADGDGSLSFLSIKLPFSEPLADPNRASTSEMFADCDYLGLGSVMF
jgi:hypothetical protein